VDHKKRDDVTTLQVDVMARAGKPDVLEQDLMAIRSTHLIYSFQTKKEDDCVDNGILAGVQKINHTKKE